MSGLEHANIRESKLARPDEVLQFVNALYDSDKAAERAKKLWTKLIFATGLAAIGGIGVMFVEPAIGLGIVLTGSAAFVGACIIRVIAGRKDVEDRKLDVICRLVDTLSPDVDPKRSMQIHVDFRACDRTSPIDKTTKWYSSSGQLVYQVDWLKLRLPLLDGSSVAIEASQTCKRKQKAKRKYTKKKDRVHEMLTVTLTPPKGFFFDQKKTTSLQKVLGGFAGDVPKLQLRGAKIRPKVATVAFRTTGSMRVYNRYGWQGSINEGLLGDQSTLRAVIVSCRAARGTLAARAVAAAG